MDTNTKQTPKSCSCRQCQWGKHCEGGKFMMKHDERAYRHNAKIQLAKGDEVILTSGPVGNYYD
jgi:hypothetical protein